MINFILILLVILMIVMIYLTINNKPKDQGISSAIKDEMHNTKLFFKDSLNTSNEKIGEKLLMISEKAIKLETTTEYLKILGSDINKLQKILGDKKTRGVYGEAQLKQILSLVYGEDNKFYSMEYKFNDGKQVDAVVFAANDLVIPIDSKFSLENFLRTTDEDKSVEEREVHSKAFLSDIKSRIEETSKYIKDGETTPYAIMFIPAESVYGEIYSKYNKAIEFAHKNKVLIASPSTLMAILNNVLMTFSIIKQNKEAKEIGKQLQEIGIDFERFNDRWDSLDKKINEIVTKKEDVAISAKKITNKFKKISKG